MNIGRLRLRARPGPLFWVLAISGILGFRIGLIGFPSWHIAVESAQVVAGLVRYPPENPFYIYHTKLWSLVIQIITTIVSLALWAVATMQGWVKSVAFVSHVSMLALVFAGISGIASGLAGILAVVPTDDVV